MRRSTAAIRVGVVAAAGFLAFVLVLGAFFLREAQRPLAFDLLRWEVQTAPNRWLGMVGALFREGPAHDEAIAAYFALPPGERRRSALENEVERIIEGRLDRILQELGLSARVNLPGTVFPPVDVELSVPPQVLVTSPRDAIRRDSTALLRPDLFTSQVLAVESRMEFENPSLSAIVLPTGGVATYPAVVSDRGTYRGTLLTAAHEWTHHYLAFYPLGLRYFASLDLTTINETLADLVGEELASLVLARWGDPTAAPVPGGGVAPARQQAFDLNAALRSLRIEVDALLADGHVDTAEARMELARQELEAAGFRIRRINQAFFAWYGSYAARPDATDPLGDQLRAIRDRTQSLPAFLTLIRDAQSRTDIQGILTRVLAETGDQPDARN